METFKIARPPKSGLLHPYPGSKRLYKKYPIEGEHAYDCVVEPFVGSGHVSTRMLLNSRVKHAFVSDCDPSVYLVWKGWRDKHKRRSVHSYVDYLRECVEISPQETYLYLKGVMDGMEACDPIEISAVSIVIRKLVFGGVLRKNTQGKLNVALSKDKMTAFPNWIFEWLPYSRKWAVEVYTEWAECLKNYGDSDYSRGLVFIDPPYYLPYTPGTRRRGTGAMTQAYMAHGDPSGEGLYRMTVDSVDQGLSSPQTKSLVLTQYWCDRLEKDLMKLALVWGYDLEWKETGRLNSMNKGMESREDSGVEVIWRFERKF